MKSVPAWVVYSVYRILLFAVPLGILLLLRIDPLVATVIAAVIGLCLSYIFLRSPRDAVSRDIFAATQRRKAPSEADSDAEDAVLDQAEGHPGSATGTVTSADPQTENPGSAVSERERGSE
jgi:uncharacterized membrane protein YraQ (UPF0718 family)